MCTKISKTCTLLLEINPPYENTHPVVNYDLKNKLYQQEYHSVFLPGWWMLKCVFFYLDVKKNLMRYVITKVNLSYTIRGKYQKHFVMI